MYTIYVKFDCLPQKREAFIQKVKETGILDAIREEEFEFDEQFEDYLHAYGFDNVHSFLKVVRRKKTMGILHD